ncbi:retrotransposon protein, putative, ty1-copia subclass [Tanacetum coccineum]
MFVIEQPLPAARAADSNAQVLKTPHHMTWMLQELKSMFEKQAGVERFDLIQTFHACKQEEGKPIAAYVLKMKGYVEQLEHLDFAGFVRNYNMHNMRKIICELHVMLIEYEKGLPKKAKTPQVMMIKSDKIQKSNKKSFKAKGKGKANGKGKDKQVYIPKPKNPKPTAKEHPAKDDTCHHYNTLPALPIKGKKRIGKLQQEGLLKSTDDESFDQCVSCLSGKMTRKSFPHHLERATDLLGIIHTDVCGPLRHVSRQGSSYFVTFTDDYNLYGYFYLLKHKHEVFETFKVFNNEVENQLRKTIKALRSNRDGEYISQEFKYYLKACGIVQQLRSIYDETYKTLAAIILLMIMHRSPATRISQSVQDQKDDILYRNYSMEKYAEFFEKNLITQEVSERAIDLKEIQDKDTLPSEITSKIPMEVEGFEPPQEDEIPISVKNILKYLRNTKDMFLVYGGNLEAELRVDCYCNAGFETDRDDIKSQTGYVFILNGGAVDWKSSKQSTTAMSATEAEYIAASEAAI